MRLLILLTILVFISVYAAIASIDINLLSGYGSIISAAAGILAVIWFSASLSYQARQIEEQRIQFLAEFKHLQETNRRDALLVAKQILDTAEHAAIRNFDEISSIAELPTRYLDCPELKPILESTDHKEVLDAFKSWVKKEGGALALLQGIKSAAEVYLRGTGTADIDYTKEPEEFVYIYGPRFMQQPFFQSFQGVATMLCEFMIRLAPGRKAAQIAFFAATAKAISKDILHIDKLRQDMKAHTAKGYPLPRIAEDL
ncbi:MAG: hypothetical protein AB1405_00145 [Bdellovibrionota bacterium]